MSKQIKNLTIGGSNLPVVNGISSNRIMGYYITAFDTTNNTITISTTEDGSGEPNEDIISQWLTPAEFIDGTSVQNQYVSFDAVTFYALYSKIISYDSETHTITVDQL